MSAGSYADAFGLQWNRYRRTQLDSYTGVPITERRARRNLGDDIWRELPGKHVLEAGCGAGRFTEVLLSRGARVTSIDLSDAVESNGTNFPPDDRHRVAQADLWKLPFEEGSFDVVFCLGVIQHTPDPSVTIRRLFEQVTPGGWLVFDHYTYNLSWYTKTAPLFRVVLRRLPPDKGLRATERLVKWFLPLHERVRHHRIGQKLVSRLSPVNAYYHEYPELPDDLQQEWSRLDTHDSLTDWHRHYRTAKQTRRLLAEVGAEIVRCERRNYVVEGRVRRPVTQDDLRQVG